MTAGRKAKRRRGRGRPGGGVVTCYAPTEPAQELVRGPRTGDPLHGYSLREITGLARGAATANRWLVSDFMIRYEAAWDAITEELLTCPARPQSHELARIGKGAVARTLLKDFAHTYGVANRDLTAGVASAPKFAAYWFRPPATPFDERICEHIGLRQIWAALRPRSRTMLRTLAAAGDYQAAADLLGVPRSSFNSYISVARREFEALWFAPDTPPAGRRRPDRRRYMYDESGLKPCGTPAAAERHRSRKEPLDEACQLAAREYDRARKARRTA